MKKTAEQLAKIAAIARKNFCLSQQKAVKGLFLLTILLNYWYPPAPELPASCFIVPVQLIYASLLFGLGGKGNSWYTKNKSASAA